MHRKGQLLSDLAIPPNEFGARKFLSGRTAPYKGVVVVTFFNAVLTTTLDQTGPCIRVNLLNRRGPH
jgi:hypothetical protein